MSNDSPDRLEQVREYLGQFKTTTIGGVTIRFKNFLTAKDDATVGSTSFLSNKREWHGAGVGFVIGFLTAAGILASYGFGVPVGVLLSALVGGGTLTARSVARTLRDSGHVRDAIEEPAYAAFGMVVAVGLLAVVIVIATIARSTGVTPAELAETVRTIQELLTETNG